MQKKYIPVAVFFAVLLVLLSHLGAKMAESAPAFTFAEEQKRVYLTFDDGPSTVVTNRILDTLKEENVKATFFIVSDRAASRKETLLRIAKEGHTVGVHSKTHDYSQIYSSDEAFLKDVTSCAEYIERTTGIKPHVYRFPGGGTASNERKKKLLLDRGFRVVSWNAVCGDEEIPNADADTLVKTAIESSAGKKSVVLLCHDSAPHKATAEALPRIIAYYRAQGYEFCAY